MTPLFPETPIAATLFGTRHNGISPAQGPGAAPNASQTVVQNCLEFTNNNYTLQPCTSILHPQNPSPISSTLNPDSTPNPLFHTPTAPAHPTAPSPDTQQQQQQQHPHRERRNSIDSYTAHPHSAGGGGSLQGPGGILRMLRTVSPTAMDIDHMMGRGNALPAGSTGTWDGVGAGRKNLNGLSRGSDSDVSPMVMRMKSAVQLGGESPGWEQIVKDSHANNQPLLSPPCPCLLSRWSRVYVSSEERVSMPWLLACLCCEELARIRTFKSNREWEVVCVLPFVKAAAQ